jgi:hypothetical protein
MAKKQADARAKTPEKKLANLRSARARLAKNKRRRTPVQSSDDALG